MAEEHAKSALEQKMVSVDKYYARKIIFLASRAARDLNQLQTEEDAENQQKILSTAFMDRERNLARLRPLVDQMQDSTGPAEVAQNIDSSGPRYVLSLYDAVTLLRCLAQTSAGIDMPTRAQIDATIDRKDTSLFNSQKQQRRHTFNIRKERQTSLEKGTSSPKEKI